MEFYVGDKVRLKKDLIVGKDYGNVRFLETMQRLCGQVLTVSYISGEGYYQLKEDWSGFLFSGEMLEYATGTAVDTLVVDGNEKESETWFKLTGNGLNYGFTVKEMVCHPNHYNQGKFEVIDVINDWKLDFNLGNTIKYIARAKHKGKELEDLKKARWYLDYEIRRLEENE